MKWKFVKQTKKKFSPKLQTWKLKDHNVINLFKDRLIHLLASDTNEKSVEDQWIRNLKKLVVFTNKENGTNRLGGGINSVNYAANEKKRLFKIWKNGG